MLVIVNDGNGNFEHHGALRMLADRLHAMTPTSVALSDQNEQEAVEIPVAGSLPEAWEHEVCNAARRLNEAIRTRNAIDLNEYAAARPHGGRFSGFLVPKGVGGIALPCPNAYTTTVPCACGCLVRYSDPYGSWCLNCGS